MTESEKTKKFISFIRYIPSILSGVSFGIIFYGHISICIFLIVFATYIKIFIIEIERKIEKEEDKDKK